MGLIVKIGADLKNFDKEMKKLTQDVNRVGEKLKGVGTKLTAAITLPVVAIGTAATMTGLKFEESMSKVAAISGATGNELQSLEDKARDLGATTKFSASEAADALSYMAMAGWKTEEMLNGIDGVLALAAASGEDLATVSDIVTDALTAFGMSAQDSGKFADVLAAASSNANTNVSMLGESFKYAAPVMGALGFTAEDTSKALALMANAGIKGSQSGTALRTMMTNLAKPTEQMSKAMMNLGISLTDNEGNMKSLDEVMLDMREAFSGLTEDQQAANAAAIFGKEAMSGALAIINASTEDYNKLSVAINNSEGAAQEMAEVMGNNLAGKMKELKSALEEIGLVIYDNIKPALEMMVSAIKTLADSFNNLSPAIQKIIITFSAIAAAIGPILVAVGTGIILFGQMKAALAILGVGFGAIVSPIALAVLAIVGIIAAFVLFGDEIKAFWNKYFKPIIDKIIQIVVSSLKPAFTQAFQTLSVVAKDVFEMIKRVANEILLPILKLIIWVVQNLLLPAFKVVFTAIGSVVADVFKGISVVWKNVLKPILTGIIDFISGVFSGNWSKAWQGIVSIFKGIFEGLKTAAKAPLNGVISVVNGFIKGLNKLKIPEWVPGVGGKGINIPLIPMLATGGNVFGNGQAIVGEAGPELLQKSGSSVRVTPLSSQEKVQGIGGAVGGSSQPIHLIMNVDGQTVATKVVDYIDLLQGSKGETLGFMGGYR